MISSRSRSESKAHPILIAKNGPSLYLAASGFLLTLSIISYRICFKRKRRSFYVDEYVHSVHVFNSAAHHREILNRLAHPMLLSFIHGLLFSYSVFSKNIFILFQRIVTKTRSS